MNHRSSYLFTTGARVLAVIAIVMMSVMTALVSGYVALALSNYEISNSGFSYGGQDYGDYGSLFWQNGASLMPYYYGEEWSLSGIENIDCGLYSWDDGSRFVTVWYEHGQKANLEAYRPAICIATEESLFIPNTNGEYEYQGNPAGWSVISGRVDPTLVRATPKCGYTITESSFSFGGTDYNFMGIGSFYYPGAGMFGLGLAPVDTYMNLILDGEDIDCGLYTLPSYGYANMTVWYPHGQKTNVENCYVDWGLGDAICIATAESLFTPNNDGVYEYQGNPEGWSVISGGTDPPVLRGWCFHQSEGRSTFVPPIYYGLPRDLSALYVMNQTYPEVATCEGWESMWDELPIWLFQLPIVGSATLVYNTGEGSGVESIGRGLVDFNTSSIPDDAVITHAFLRANIYEYAGNFSMVLGGTHNASILPWRIEEEVPFAISTDVNYSESEFYGDFGRLNIGDVPVGGGTDQYIDITLNNDGLGYINVSGMTTFSFREESDINGICPTELEEVALFTNRVGGQGADMTLVVDWHMPGDEPIPSDGLISPQVAVMMDIIALLFLTGFIVGLLFVIAKSDGMPMATKAGIVTTVAVMAVVGVIIIESLVVAFK